MATTQLVLASGQERRNINKLKKIARSIPITIWLQQLEQCMLALRMSGSQATRKALSAGEKY
jgi:hypothetical protein